MTHPQPHKRSKVETTIISIDVFTEVQQEPDGSWVAVINLPEMTRAASGETRLEALWKVSNAASVRVSYETQR